MDELIEQQRAHFNLISESYFRARQHPNHLLLKDLVWKYFIKRNHTIAKEISSVLEPMCGMAEGYTIIGKYLQSDFDYLGFDYSENMVEFARQTHPTLDIQWGDVMTFKPEDERFDLVVLIGGLHHVYRHTEEVIAKLSKSLRPGGYFLSFEPTHNNFLSRMARNRIYKKNVIFDVESEQGYEYRDLRSYFENSGFSKVDEIYPGLLAYILYYNPDAFPILNRGGKLAVKSMFALDRLFISNWLGKKLSFATITLWKLTNAAGNHD